ncbi:MAG: hypothetical protein C4527_00650 [Candidatus Omnitrophota bacterium]|nr:MAG: hypothetical protein C4527_00650 [Candidatus Omnitrophota bacterium]
METISGNKVFGTFSTYDWYLKGPGATVVRELQIYVDGSNRVGSIFFTSMSYSGINLRRISIKNIENDNQHLMIAAITLLNTIPPTPTPTQTPLPTSTPTYTPTPIPEGISLEDFSVLPVPNFDLPLAVDYGFVPTDNDFAGATDGSGMLLFLKPGEGAFLLGNTPVDLEQQMIELSVSARATSDKVQMGLVAFAGGEIGSDFGYVNPVQREVPVNKWGKMSLIYDSPSPQIIPALQFVVEEGVTSGLNTVYIDTLQVAPIKYESTQSIHMQGDNTFDSVNRLLVGVNPNAFLPQGEIPGIVSLTQGMSGQGIGLSLLANQLASHVALFSIAPQMPVMIHGSVYVKRENGEDGTIAFMITDGEQSVARFLPMQSFPIGEFKEIHIGGNFEIGGKQTPPIAVVQLGGPNVNGSVIIDNLELFMTE